MESLGRRAKTALNPDDISLIAMDPDERINQLKALAIEQAEKQLREGTASSQVVTHFLKIDPEEDRLKLENLRIQNRLLEAKIEELKASRDLAELTSNALKAFKTYSGEDDDDEV